jgi:hypothetical protein
MSESAATKVTKFPGAESPRGGEIFRAIPEVMKEVGSVGKDRKNVQQNYQFRGIDDVYAAVQLVLAKHGVFVVPEVMDEKWEERETKAGGVLQWVRSRIKHTFYASDGSSFSAVTFGEGMDSGDKASNKAMSTAMKYALVEVLCIPTRDAKDPEDDSHEVKPRKDAKQAAPAAWKPAGDDGTVIEEQRADRLRKMFLDELKLTKKEATDHLASWFGATGGVMGLSDGMGKTAELLCLALQAGGDAYTGKLAELRKQGLVRAEAV